MIFEDMTREEQSLLEEKLILTYQQKGISFEDESLYLANGAFKEKEEMPRLSDLYEELKKDKETKRLALLLKPYVLGSMKFLNQYTNVDLNNQVVVSDVYEIEEKDLPIVLYILTEFFWDKIKENRGEKKILYLDEAWRLLNQNKNTAEFVFKVFKTIRKYGGAATVITQDIGDFFALDDGKYGKAILNNSSMKCLFQLEENELKVIKGVIDLSEQEQKMISSLKRGECVFHAGREQVLLDVEASPQEHEFMTTDRKDLSKMGE